eukprot:6191716-Pleurochrysis_carterae.AAC.3
MELRALYRRLLRLMYRAVELGTAKFPKAQFGMSCGFLLESMTKPSVSKRSISFETVRVSRPSSRDRQLICASPVCEVYRDFTSLKAIVDIMGVINMTVRHCPMLDGQFWIQKTWFLLCETTGILIGHCTLGARVTATASFALCTRTRAIVVSAYRCGSGGATVRGRGQPARCRHGESPRGSCRSSVLALYSTGQLTNRYINTHYGVVAPRLSRARAQTHVRTGSHVAALCSLAQSGPPPKNSQGYV